MNSFKINLHTVAISMIMVFVGCNFNDDGDSGNQPDSLNVSSGIDSLDGNNFKLYSLPSPLQIATAIKVFNLGYQEKLLNPTNKSIAEFPTNYLKALNLGIFGVDMGYSSMYKKDQTTIYYMSIMQKLSTELDILSGFDVNSVKQFEKHLNNQDSLTTLILTAFSKTHKYLQDNDQEDIGLLVITGSFIEGMYLIIGLADNNYDNNVKQIIGMQKEYIANLIELLYPYNPNPDINGLILELEGINTIYNEIDIVYSEKGDVEEFNISGKQIDRIMEKISTIRNRIVS